MDSKHSSASSVLDRFSLPLGLQLLILSVGIGSGTGLAAVLFVKLIYAIQHICYSYLPKLVPFLGAWIYLFAPVMGGLLVGPLIYFAKEAKGHGIPEVMRAIIVNGGRIRARVAVAKIAASALCIGTGGSAGREGPIVQVGSALGSSIGQVLKLSDERIRNLVACGAAAGIAATFNAPIAGVIFAIEVLMAGLQVRSFGNVVIASVSSAVVSRIFLGDRPAFDVPAYTMISPVSIIFYLILGVAAALVGIGFIRMLNRAEIIFDEWDFPQLLKPAVGAVFLGMLGVCYMQFPAISQSLAMPQMYGSGFPYIETVIQGNTTWWILAALVLLKPLATSFTLGSGNSGGVFAPSLFTGAMLGGALGHFFELYFPEYAGNSGAYALVGMAALFSATARAPLTAMLIVFEMSNDYHLILPLMVTGITASYMAQWLHPESIYTLKLAKKGIRFAEGRDMDIMQGVKVHEVMRKNPVTIHKDRSVNEVMALFQETNLLGLPVLADDCRLFGIITLQDVHKAQAADDFDSRKMTVADVATTSAITVYPDDQIWHAIQKMAPRDIARLPVVSRTDSSTLVGTISRSDILRAYDVGVVRKQRGKLEEAQTNLRQTKEAGFVEFVLTESDSCNQALVKDLSLPETINLVSVKRGNQVIIPRGTTRLLSGDVITVFGQVNDVDEIRGLLNRCGKSL
ncbi:MAG: chloride channel protein [Deltaproteobacteria bacterium]|nr:MAG: chloride channel protein [Deltaproteobacteria bacterium]